MAEAHVIDSFVVELGLDASKFNAQQRAAVDGAKRNVDGLRKQGAEAEEAFDRVSDSLTSLGKRAVGIFSLLAGTSSVTAFIAGTVHAGAEVGRLSRAIGVSANEISRWQGVAKEFGSSGEQMASSFKEISNVFTAWNVGGPEAPGIMQMFRVINTEAERLDANNAKVIDHTKGVAQGYLDLADNLKIIQSLSKDPNLASYLAGKIPGMDSGMFDLLIQGGDKVQEMLKRTAGWSDSEAEAAGRVERRWLAAQVALSQYLKTKMFESADAAHPLAHELFDKPIMESKPFDAIFGWGEYSRKGVSTLTKPSVNSTQTAPTRGGAFQSKAEKVAFIREEAKRQGQNPDVWVKLAASEGLNQYKGDLDATGKPTSFGALQLHYPGVGRNTADGLGSRFTKETGLDARNPETEAAQIAWSMRYARSHGLRDWHGWKGGAFANLEGVQQSSSSTSTSTYITGPITISAGPNATAGDIAAKLRDLGMKRQAEGNQSSVGGN